MREFTTFHLIPSEKIEPGKQVLLKELEHHYVAHYEGSSDLADAYIIWALTGMENDKDITPILLVNEDDFHQGVYGDFEDQPQTE